MFSADLRGLRELHQGNNVGSETLGRRHRSALLLLAGDSRGGLHIGRLQSLHNKRRRTGTETDSVQHNPCLECRGQTRRLRGGRPPRTATPSLRGGRRKCNGECAHAHGLHRAPPKDGARLGQTCVKIRPHHPTRACYLRYGTETLDFVFVCGLFCCAPSHACEARAKTRLHTRLLASQTNARHHAPRATKKVGRANTSYRGGHETARRPLDRLAKPCAEHILTYSRRHVVCQYPCCAAMEY